MKISTAGLTVDGHGHGADAEQGQAGDDPGCGVRGADDAGITGLQAAGGQSRSQGRDLLIQLGIAQATGAGLTQGK